MTLNQIGLSNSGLPLLAWSRNPISSWPLSHPPFPYDRPHLVLESHLKHAVGLVQHEVLDGPQVESLYLSKVMEQAAWGGRSGVGQRELMLSARRNNRKGIEVRGTKKILSA